MSVGASSAPGTQARIWERLGNPLEWNDVHEVHFVRRLGGLVPYGFSKSDARRGVARDDTWALDGQLEPAPRRCSIFRDGARPAAKPAGCRNGDTEGTSLFT
jgi:hypothetical protein